MVLPSDAITGSCFVQPQQPHSQGVGGPADSAKTPPQLRAAVTGAIHGKDKPTMPKRKSLGQRVETSHIMRQIPAFEGTEGKDGTEVGQRARIQTPPLWLVE